MKGASIGLMLSKEQLFLFIQTSIPKDPGLPLPSVHCQLHGEVSKLESRLGSFIYGCRTVLEI